MDVEHLGGRMTVLANGQIEVNYPAGRENEFTKLINAFEENR